MRTGTVKRTAAVLAAAALGVAGFTIGRLSAPDLTPAIPPHPSSTSADYIAGFQAGAAQGRQEGRALQEGVSLPTQEAARVREAFAAGANDVFTGYDGGWAMSTPYLVTLVAGSGQITYRIGSRTPLSPHTAYFLCPDGHDVCQQPQR